MKRKKDQFFNVQKELRKSGVELLGSKKEEVWFTNPDVRLFAPLLGASSIRGLFGFFSAPKFITVGPMGLREFAYMIRELRYERRAFIVTDKGVRKYAEEVEETMKEFDFMTEIWDKSQPEPPIESVQECADAMKEFAPDLVIGVGGGSAIDTAKVAWIVYEKPELDAREAAYLPLVPPEKVNVMNMTLSNILLPMVSLGLRKKAYLAAIPTTSGTGSDCTMAAVITDNSFSPPKKITTTLPELTPDFSIIVPKFAAGMPPELARNTGLDVLAHAFEGLCGILASDFSDMFSLKAIELTFHFLPRSYKNRRDMEAKTKMHIAASMGGIAISNGGNAITHALGHALGKVYGLHHGLAVGVFVPYVLQYYSRTTDRWRKMAELLGMKGRTKDEILANLVEHIKNFFRELGVPTSLKDLGIDEEDFQSNLDDLVNTAYEDEACLLSPRITTPPDLRSLFLRAYEGHDVDF